MRIHNIYADAAGESHIREIDIEWTHAGPTGKTSDPVQVSSVSFRVTDGNYNLGWHNAPRRQYIVNLEGSVEITTSDGESRIIGPGGIILAEDTTGKGHLSKAVAGGTRRSLVIPLAG
jgi:quercetin dioxygenase-like cupin family protein